MQYRERKISVNVRPWCKTKGCGYHVAHAWDCKITNIGPWCKNTKGCMRHVAHAGDCSIPPVPGLGTPGTKCSKNIGCIRWDGHSGWHKKLKYETSTAGGSSLEAFNEFMGKLQDFPDDEKLAARPFLDEIAEDEPCVETICQMCAVPCMETICQTCAVHILCRRNPGVCMKPDKRKGMCTGPKCKTKGCMKMSGHEGDCKISTMVGKTERCKTKGCSMRPDHEGECMKLVIIGPRCKTKGCMMIPDHS
jgi:hypothetical protein